MRCAGFATIVCLLMVGDLDAHSGPPFPVVSNRIAGQYDVSIWTDPDATDDGSAAGQFWVVLRPIRKGTELPPDTRVNVEVWPLDRAGAVQRGTAAPVARAVARQFAALVMDHEGRFGVRALIDGPLGSANVEAEVAATYDLRPQPILLVLYVLPFLMVGFLWVKLLVRRRARKKN
ncbi:MAG TPA: hypothetical protein VH701_07380 [Vicinamibacterales bacterium]|jgi:hypothetical protein